MSIDPDLSTIRTELDQVTYIPKAPPEELEAAASIGGMIVMGLVLLALIYDFNQPRHVADSFDILVFLGAPILGFIVGGIVVHLLYYGAKTMLFLIKYFWWAFVLGFIGLGYFAQN